MQSSFDLRMKTGVYRAAALVCVFLILLTGFIAAVHVHPGQAAASDHACSICALAHAGVIPVALGAPVPIFVSSDAFEPAAQTSRSLFFVSSLYIRPPPVA